MAMSRVEIHPSGRGYMLLAPGKRCTYVYCRFGYWTPLGLQTNGEPEIFENQKDAVDTAEAMVWDGTPHSILNAVLVEE